LRQAPPEVAVATTRMNDASVELHVAFDGRASRLAEDTGVVDVFDNDGSVRARGAHHSREHFARAVQMAQKEARVDDIVGVALAEIGDIPDAKLHVPYAELGGVLRREPNLHVVHVDPDNASGRSCASCHLQCDVAATASDIERDSAFAQARPTQKIIGGRRENVREQPQSRFSFGAATYRVLLHRIPPSGDAAIARFIRALGER
jgi:hypothetical protein